MTVIHPTAVVHSNAQLDSKVEIGPYCVIEENVSIASGTVLGPGVHVQGITSIGQDNRITGYSSIGGMPQDKKYGGECTRLQIGNRNTIREYCSLHVGTVQDAGVTRVGDDNWIMSYVHIAHDCVISDNIVISNFAQIAGHVQVGSWVVLGGAVTVHQHVLLGEGSMIGMSSSVRKDIPPYVLAAGPLSAKPRGVNTEGLQRRGFGLDRVSKIKQLYRWLYRSDLSLEDARKKISEMDGKDEDVLLYNRFFTKSCRGIAR